MKLREARVRSTLSRAKLADKANVSEATIRDSESGKYLPSLNTCGKVAEALGLPPQEIDEFRAAMQRSLGN